MSYSNYSMYLKSKRSKEHCCCVTGPTGPAGPPAADGTFWGDYLFWDPNVLQWVVGSNRINLGAHAGEFFIDSATGLQNLQPNVVALGTYAGYTGQHQDAVAVGASAAAINQEEGAVALGKQCGYTGQGEFAIAIGKESAIDSQGKECVAIGFQAGTISQGGTGATGGGAIAIGVKAGTTQRRRTIGIGGFAGFGAQQPYSIALGWEAGRNNQGITPPGITGNAFSLAIGYNAGRTSQEPKAVAIGYLAGQIDQSVSSIAIGDESGVINQAQSAVAIGRITGRLNQAPGCVAIGSSAGNNTQGDGVGNSIAIGSSAGSLVQSERAIAIGAPAGEKRQQPRAIAIGFLAGHTGILGIGQHQDSIAIGTQAGYFTQAEKSIAIGWEAGYTGQGTHSVAIGREAGRNFQASFSIAHGHEAGYTGQANNSIAIGNRAGKINQGQQCIAIGPNAGYTGAGDMSITIGNNAGRTDVGENAINISTSLSQSQGGTGSVCINASDGNNSATAQTNSILINASSAAGNHFSTTGSIVLNAGNTALGGLTPFATYINPVRNVVNSEWLVYNNTTKEVTKQAKRYPIAENFVFGLSMSQVNVAPPNNIPMTMIIQNQYPEYLPPNAGIAPPPVDQWGGPPIGHWYASRGSSTVVGANGQYWPEYGGLEAPQWWLIPGHETVIGNYEPAYKGDNTAPTPINGQGSKGTICAYAVGVNWDDIGGSSNRVFHYNTPKGLNVSYHGPMIINRVTITLNETGGFENLGTTVGAGVPQIPPISLAGHSVYYLIKVFTYCDCDRFGRPIEKETAYVSVHPSNKSFSDYEPWQPGNPYPNRGGYCKCVAFNTDTNVDGYAPGVDRLTVGCSDEKEQIGVTIYPLQDNLAGPIVAYQADPAFSTAALGPNPLPYFTWARSIGVTLHGVVEDEGLDGNAPM